MRATITKIDPMRIGRKGTYRMVFFKLDSGGSASSFISEDMKNYRKWKPLLEVGNVIDGLKWIGAHIDGDSDPVLFSRPDKQEELF